MVLKSVLSSRTRVDIERVMTRGSHLDLKCESCFADRTAIEDLADRTAQK